MGNPLSWLGKKSTKSAVSRKIGKTERQLEWKKRSGSKSNPSPLRVQEQRRNVDNQVISGHNMVMKRAKVSEVKARLSAYIAEVRSGDTVVICDRSTPIAQLVPLDPKVDELRIQAASKPASEISMGRAVRLRKRINVDKMLSEARGGR